MKIDTSRWKEFKLGGKDGLFDIQKGKRLTSEDQTEGPNIYIGAIDSNNGVSNHIGQAPIHNGNTISLSYNGSVGEAFYQPDPYWATDDVNALYLKSEYGFLNPYTALFLCTILRREKYRFSYGRKWTLENMKTTTVRLPADSSGQPDWGWMENFIKSLHHKPITTSCKVPLPLDAAASGRDWGDFKVSALFDVQYGINMELNTCCETTDDDPEAVAFVARTAENNGVSAFVKPVEGKTPQPAGTITVAGGGSVLSTFLQVRPFYSGRDLYLLFPKNEMNVYVKLFIITVLQREKYRFNYGRQANKSLRDLNLHLPVTGAGDPDWEFMEDYIKSLPYADRLVQSEGEHGKT